MAYLTWRRLNFLGEDKSTKVGAKNAQSTTRHQANGSVQFDSDKVRTWVLPLMKRIYAGDYPTQAGRILGLLRWQTAKSRSNLSRKTQQRSILRSNNRGLKSPQIM
jgi:hypothetical protein